jgi:methionyl-tRNA formyltransferase
MTDTPLRIIFMGTPDFAKAALGSILKAGFVVDCVYTQPPRPKGRGQDIQKSAVHKYADAHDIPVFTPKSLKSAEEQDRFCALKPDIAIVAAYGLILPKEILNAPKFGCINIHASLLPRWRGASPIQRAIWAGDSETGITIMQMDEGLDTGPMISKRAIGINADTTTVSLHNDLAEIGGEMIVEILGQISRNRKIESVAQDNSKSNYAPVLKKDDGKIDWSQDAPSIHRQIRALNPWPGTWTVFDGKRIKILEAALSPHTDHNGVGAFMDSQGHINCGNGTALKILILQPEGKKPMDFKSAINGGYVKPGGMFK